MRQLGALPRLQDGEDDHGEEGPQELRQCGVDIQNSKVDT
jgi:hypothetical protein